MRARPGGSADQRAKPQVRLQARPRLRPLRQVPADDTSRAGFVHGLVVMLHSLSLHVIAEGVSGEADAAALWLAGVDGQTGPWVSRQHEQRTAG